MLSINKLQEKLHIQGSNGIFHIPCNENIHWECKFVNCVYVFKCVPKVGTYLYLLLL